MVRVRMGVARHGRKRRLLKLAKGYRGNRSKCYRMAMETLLRAWNFAFRDRRARKRDFRRLWITRLSAAATARDINYSRFIFGAKKAGIELNRKQLSEIAIHDPAGFDAICKRVKDALA